MTNCRRSDISEYDDINTLDQYQLAIHAGCTKEQALEACYENSRDNARTPMQWSDGPNAGFTSGTPWLALNPNYREINAAEQESRPDSLLNYYKRLIALRKSAPAFTYADTVPMFETLPGILAYGRGDLLVAGNYGTEPQVLDVQPREILLTNLDIPVENGRITLPPCGSIVALV